MSLRVGSCRKIFNVTLCSDTSTSVSVYIFKSLKVNYLNKRLLNIEIRSWILSFENKHFLHFFHFPREVFFLSQFPSNRGLTFEFFFYRICLEPCVFVIQCSTVSYGSVLTLVYSQIFVQALFASVCVDCFCVI